MIFTLCFYAAADENRAGGAKPATDYREDMRRFVITISQYGKNLIKTLSSSRKTGLSSLPKTAQLAASCGRATYAQSRPWAPSRCFTATRATTSPPTPMQANTCLSSAASTRKTACVRSLQTIVPPRAMWTLRIGAIKKRLSFFCCG